MKKFKKYLTIVSIALGTTLVLAGCGNKVPTTTNDSTNNTTKETPKASSVATSEKPELEPYEIVWYQNGNGPQADLQQVQDEINKYIQPKINATVKIVQVDWGSYDQKMMSLLATGEKIDLAFSCSWALNYNTAAMKGWLTDVTDKLNQNAPNAKKVLEQSGFLEAAQIDGKIYTLPCHKEKGNQCGFVFNKQLVDQYGFDLETVKSFKDLEPMLKVIKEKEPGVTPLLMGNGATICEGGLNIDCNVMVGVGLGFDEKAQQYKPLFDNPKYLEWIGTAHDFYKKGYINTDAATLADFNPIFKAGKAFCMPLPLKPGKDAELTVQYGLPVVQKGITAVMSSQSDMVGSMMGIPSTSKDPERVLMFYDLFYSDPYLVNLMDYGIENKHWVWVDKDKQIIDFAQATENGTKSGWAPGTNWMYGDQFLSYKMKVEDPDKWEKYKAFNESAVKTPDFGFAFNTEPVKQQLAALANINQEFEKGFYTGTLDPEQYLSKWQEKAKAAALEKVVQEINTQYQAFKK